MSDKYIIDKVAGTVLNLSDCYIINSDLLGDNFTDSEIAELADTHGQAVSDLVRKPREIFFDFDGQYGFADDLLVVDTSEWTHDEVVRVSNCLDSERRNIAEEIAKKYRKGDQ